MQLRSKVFDGRLCDLLVFVAPKLPPLAAVALTIPVRDPRFTCKTIRLLTCPPAPLLLLPLATCSTSCAFGPHAQGTGYPFYPPCKCAQHHRRLWHQVCCCCCCCCVKMCLMLRSAVHAWVGRLLADMPLTPSPDANEAFFISSIGLPLLGARSIFRPPSPQPSRSPQTTPSSHSHTVAAGAAPPPPPSPPQRINLVFDHPMVSSIMLHAAVPLLTSKQCRRCSLKALSDSILTLSVIKVRPLAASAISQPFLLFRLFPFSSSSRCKCCRTR